MNIPASTYSSNSAAVNGGLQNTRKESEDPVLRSLNTQIENLTKKIQELSANTKLSLKDKQARKQELQDQLTALKTQVTQRKMQLQQAKIQERARAMEEQAAGHASKNPSEEKASNIDTFEMKNLIAAQNSISQVYTAEGVKVSLEGRVGVLAQEIKLDAARGMSVSGKAAELGALNAKISGIDSANAGRMADANEIRKPETEKVPEEKGGEADSDVNAAEKNTELPPTEEYEEF